jgi:hypothetical protein
MMDERQVELAMMHSFFLQRGEDNTAAPIATVIAALGAALQRTREVAA